MKQDFVNSTLSIITVLFLEFEVARKERYAGARLKREKVDKNLLADYIMGWMKQDCLSFNCLELSSYCSACFILNHTQVDTYLS